MTTKQAEQLKRGDLIETADGFTRFVFLVETADRSAGTISIGGVELGTGDGAGITMHEMPIDGMFDFDHDEEVEIFHNG